MEYSLKVCHGSNLFTIVLMLLHQESYGKGVSEIRRKDLEEYGGFLLKVFFSHICFWAILVQNSNILEEEHWEIN